MLDKTRQNSCLQKNLSKIIDLSNDDNHGGDDSDVEDDYCNGNDDDHDNVSDDDDAHDHDSRGQKSGLC